MNRTGAEPQLAVSQMQTIASEIAITMPFFIVTGASCGLGRLQVYSSVQPAAHHLVFGHIRTKLPLFPKQQRITCKTCMANEQIPRTSSPCKLPQLRSRCSHPNRLPHQQCRRHSECECIQQASLFHRSPGDLLLEGYLSSTFGIDAFNLIYTVDTFLP